MQLNKGTSKHRLNWNTSTCNKLDAVKIEDQLDIILILVLYLILTCCTDGVYKLIEV